MPDGLNENDNLQYYTHNDDNLKPTYEYWAFRADAYKFNDMRMIKLPHNKSLIQEFIHSVIIILLTRFHGHGHLRTIILPVYTTVYISKLTLTCETEVT